MILQVRHAMQTKPYTIDSEETVTETAYRMIQIGTDTLVVLYENEIKGTIDQRDVLRYTYTQGFRPNQTPVSEITNSDVVFARPTTSLEDALTIMTETKQYTLAVVDRELVGTINIFDLLKAQPQTKPLEVISHQS
ncbi:CBS domain-containing protein [Candidatus Bathyarchaeota archaeon]|nr:CBS domain-containing protein [Candidatus Bathyarchaeota archaeon]